MPFTEDWNSVLVEPPYPRLRMYLRPRTLAAVTPFPAAAADLRLVIQASAPQSNGITRAYSKAATIGGARACNTEEINLKVDYEEKNGTPSAAAPKVFMKYFLVNTKTGEKSGEMMAIAKL